jgi:hypothetical protein
VGDRNGPYIVYDYTGNRRREGPEEFLRGYNGFLQADAYSAYDAMFTNPRRSLTEIACWAHARRYFFEAQSSDLCRATVMLAYIQLLYEVEREARNATAERRRELHQAKSPQKSASSFRMQRDLRFGGVSPLSGTKAATLEQEQPEAIP